MKTSETVAAIFAALAKAQAQVKGASKDSINPHFKSKYADLASVWEACREALTANGLSIIQGGDDIEAGGQVRIVTRLCHGSGEWIESSLTAPVQQATAQGVVACVTYLRRASLAAMVGVAPEDDDGEAASGRGVQMTTTASGKPIRAKIDVITGEVKTKKSVLTPEQEKECGELRTEISNLGGETGDKSVREIWNRFKYSDPEALLEALAAEAGFWRKIDAERKASEVPA